MLFNAYRRGAYPLELHRDTEYLAGTTDERIADSTLANSPAPPEQQPDPSLREPAGLVLPAAAPPEARAYPPSLFLESIGQPYLSSGGGPSGTFVRGGGSLLFSDVLGERKLGLALQFGNHISDLGVGFQFLNRQRRWNWGAVAELQPFIRALPRQRLV